MERSPAHNALMNYRQADEDGVMVEVSRQAIHDVSDEIEALLGVLKPFADLAKHHAADAKEWRNDDSVHAIVSIGDLRAATEALNTNQ